MKQEFVLPYYVPPSCIVAPRMDVGAQLDHSAAAQKGPTGVPWQTHVPSSPLVAEKLAVTLPSPTAAQYADTRQVDMAQKGPVGVPQQTHAPSTPAAAEKAVATLPSPTAAQYAEARQDVVDVSPVVTYDVQGDKGMLKDDMLEVHHMPERGLLSSPIAANFWPAGKQRHSAAGVFAATEDQTDRGLRL
jgi:hypothetical protein